MLCTNCLADLPKTNFHLLRDNTVLNKFAAYPEVSFAYPYLNFSKKGIVQKLLHELKYEGNEEVGIIIGRWFGSELKKVGYDKEIDIIVPVPLHISKYRTRGYNQSEVFARGLAEALEIEMAPRLIKRIKKTMTQTRKGKVERWENVDNIFKVTDQTNLNNKKVLLVDDVVTTGATLNSCIEALVKSGAQSIGVVTIASAD